MNETLTSKKLDEVDKEEDTDLTQKGTERKSKKLRRPSLMGRVGMIMNKMHSSVSRSRREPAIVPIIELESKDSKNSESKDSENSESKDSVDEEEKKLRDMEAVLMQMTSESARTGSSQKK